MAQNCEMWNWWGEGALFGKSMFEKIMNNRNKIIPTCRKYRIMS